MATKEKVNAKFICADIRDVKYDNEYDVVINMTDGAIGYLENDDENLKIFDLISKSLKRGGKHFMNICNAEFAEMHFPMKNWEFGEKSLSLPEFHWDMETRRMLYGGIELKIGDVLIKPEFEFKPHSSTRLYSPYELAKIFFQGELTRSSHKINVM
jgi:hypothetical protein